MSAPVLFDVSWALRVEDFGDELRFVAQNGDAGMLTRAEVFRLRAALDLWLTAVPAQGDRPLRAETSRSAVSFFDHLDGCAQCKGQPFNLCTSGARLLREAAEHAGKEIEAWLMGGAVALPAEPSRAG